MGRLDDIERRLEEWARWKTASNASGLGFATVDMSAEGARDGYREATIPTGAIEAELTNQAIMTLASEVRRTVEVMYLEGGGKAAKARRLCCTEATIDARIWMAHRKISQWFTEHEAGKRAQFERDEAIRRAARP